MGKYSMMRWINSAQRRIEILEPRTSQTEGLTKLTIEIQGIVTEMLGEEGNFAYPDMAEMGTRKFGVKGLSIWERLLRRPGKIGDIRSVNETQIQVTFWTEPVVDLLFDLENESESELWEECEILFLSAGYHFRVEPGLAEPETTPFRLF